MPTFWVGFSKQRKKPRWRTSSNCVENAFFPLSPSKRNGKPPLGSNSTRSDSYLHFELVFSSSAKSCVDERRPIALKTRFFVFPHRSETKKHPWDQILRGRIHTSILGWFFQAAQKAGLTKVVQLRSKRVFSTFPSGAKWKNTLAIEIQQVGFIPPFLVGFSKQRKKPAWRRSSNCVDNAFFRLSPSGRNKKKHRWDRIRRRLFHTTILGGLFQAVQKAELTNIVKLSSKRVFRLSPSGRNEKTPLGSKSTTSVSYQNFGWAFPSSKKSRSDEYRQIEFKTRFSTFPIGAKRKNTLGIEIHDVGFIPKFWVGFSKQQKKPKWRISSNWVQNAFFDFPHRGETKKHPWDRNPRRRFHTKILGGLFQAAKKAEVTNIVKLSSKRVFRLCPTGQNEKTPLGLNSTRSVSYHHFDWAFPSSAKSRIDEYRQIEFKTRFSTFLIGAKRKNTVGIEFHEVGFIPPFWVGFSKKRKKPNWRISSNWV